MARNARSLRGVFHTRLAVIIAGLQVVTVASSSARADDWRFRMTVDNQYQIYFGSMMATQQFVGANDRWESVETWNVANRSAADYIYVVCASDHDVLQGFLGHFENLTTGKVESTGGEAWKVFPAGQYAAQLGLPPSWPASVNPTQAQVDSAIALAAGQNLWITPDTFAGWDNDATTEPPAPFVTTSWATSQYTGAFQAAGIPANARWIWHDATLADPTSGVPDPFGSGTNHDEFLIFRIPGAVPEPTSLCVVLGALSCSGRRRRDGCDGSRSR